MAKISSTGKQFTITVPKDLIEVLNMDSKTEVIISKFPEKKILFVEKVGKNG
jgi:bifunctional DNA-binding transcriptional regulator/antitoxin component of YhaV-PrlF toxin-antitoxin module|tara:strand:+ start:81 stop:236 length:156 start_codon:yes stop_codon:yes gene_type:complete